MGLPHMKEKKMGDFRKNHNVQNSTESTSAYKRAQAKIAQAKMQELTGLDLSVQFRNDKDRLITIPSEISELTSLTYLNLGGNKLREVPISISELRGLTELILYGNELSTLPNFIGELTNLTELILYGNLLLEVPECIKNLPKLSVLNLGVNQLDFVPYFLGELTNLKVLNLGNNQLMEVPKILGNLRNLKTLNLGGNQLTEVPEFIYKLLNLCELDLYGNNLQELPEFLGRSTHLTKLILGSNQLKEIPSFIANLPNLEILHLNNNPIENPPFEILNLKQGQANLNNIRSYFRQIEIQGIARLYEAKLLILGEAGAGKTTFAKKLTNPNYQLDTQEASTEGIDVSHIEFPLPDGNSFRINIWDFGGQEIYHATHQFFLTARSLYTLVSDTRKEDTDFHYWLNAVELLSDNSPLLIIPNEKQGRPHQINERQLRGQFTNLEKVLPTDLATNRDLDQILKEIQHQITNLPHVGTPLPKTWVKVRRALEDESRPYIPATEFYALCDTHGFKQQRDKEQLSGFLHDLGVHLHFQNDPLLKRWVILQPEWGTTAVYNALDNDQVRKNFGHFSRQDLASIWHEPTYADMQDELLQLMINFKLCYRVPHTHHHYIAPQLLEPNPPDYSWEADHNLQLRYRYEFMPKGILTRFIVALHQHIEGQRLVWKTGVVLAKDNTRAEVIEFYNQKEIQIRVTGNFPCDLLTIVVHQLDDIHRTFKRLKVTKLVPCNCVTCAENPTPHFYPFDNLRERLTHGRERVECQKPPYEMVAVRPLLDNVFGQSWARQERRDIFSDARLLDEAGMLFGEVRVTLLSCEGFGSNQQLSAIFADPRLKTWQVTLPEANSAGERVDFVLDYLRDKENAHGENSLVLFLQVLSERSSAGDASRGRLEDLLQRLA
jgi:Leucine-rich repeat (LRR) protein/GTPase SAR1 family protein